MLRLDAEEEGGGEAVDAVDAVVDGVAGVAVDEREGRQVDVSRRDEPPDHREAEPAQEETAGEDEESPPPLSVHQRREDVLKADTSGGRRSEQTRGSQVHLS